MVTVSIPDVHFFTLLPSFLRLFVVLLPDLKIIDSYQNNITDTLYLLVYSAPAVVVGGLPVQLVVLPHPDPLVAVAEVQDPVPVLLIVHEIPGISKNINMNIMNFTNRTSLSPVTIGPDVLPPALPGAALREVSLVDAALRRHHRPLLASVLVVLVLAAS